MGKSNPIITFDVSPLETEVLVETSSPPEDTTPNDEAKIRAMVREMWAMPEGREALEWLFNLPPAKFEYVVQRLNKDVNRPKPRTTDEEIREVVADHICEQFPNAPEDAHQWNQWPA